jgi:putative acyl-CoA dehydrogenase
VRKHFVWISSMRVCKRSVELTGEAMEVLGGNGYVDQGIVARLFKEAPVNSIWEGSGNVMCLDVVRALSREARLVEALISDLTEMSDGCSILTGSSRTSMWTLSCHARWPCDETGSFSMNLIAALVQSGKCILRERGFKG